MEDPINKGIQKFCSYFILICKNCGERFTILRDHQECHNLSSAENSVAYCPYCGKKSKPKLWAKLK